MSPWTRFRRWRHLRGHHRLCREVRVVDHYDYTEQWFVGVDENGAERRVDITALGGRPIYKRVHG